MAKAYAQNGVRSPVAPLSEPSIADAINPAFPELFWQRPARHYDIVIGFCDGLAGHFAWQRRVVPEAGLGKPPPEMNSVVAMVSPTFRRPCTVLAFCDHQHTAHAIFRTERQLGVMPPVAIFSIIRNLWLSSYLRADQGVKEYMIILSSSSPVLKKTMTNCRCCDCAPNAANCRQNSTKKFHQENP
jgi:hypothetical protein